MRSEHFRKQCSRAKYFKNTNTFHKHRKPISTPPELFYKKAIVKNFAIFTGKHLCSCNFIKKRLQHRCFPVNSVKLLRKPILRTSVNGCFCHFSRALYVITKPANDLSCKSLVDFQMKCKTGLNHLSINMSWQQR